MVLRNKVSKQGANKVCKEEEVHQCVRPYHYSLIQKDETSAGEADATEWGDSSEHQAPVHVHLRLQYAYWHTICGFAWTTAILSVFFGDDRSSREFLLRACPPPVGRLVNVDPMEERNEARLLVRIFAVKRIGTGVAGRCPSWRHARQPKKKMARATSSPCRVGISLALAWPGLRRGRSLDLLVFSLLIIFQLLGAIASVCLSGSGM